MLRNLLLTLSLFLVSGYLAFSQSGALKGKLLDKEKKEPVPFANIVLELGGTMIGGATSDFEGNYTIKPIPPGKYDVKASYVGYKTSMVTGIVISADQIKFLDIELEPTAQEITGVVITEYVVPLIDKDQTTSGGTVTSEQIQKMPNRSANAVATTIGGVFSADGERGNVRGSRSDATVMYIDGIKVQGSSSLPPSAIEQVSVLLGGLPAQYGDARGGVINVTTKGPSRKFGAGFELETSQFLDKFGYNRLGFNMQGPLIKGKKESSSSVLGYFIAGDLSYEKDGRPTSTGLYVAKDDYLTFLQENPLRLTGLSSGGTYQNAAFTLKENLDKIDASKNSAQYGVNLSAKIDVKTTETTTLTFGGQLNYNKGKNFSLGNSMFNYDKNTLTWESTWRVFGRFTQRFRTDNESKSLVKNVYYSLQGDYSKYNSTFMDPDHKEDLFKYGYLGKFMTYKTSTFEQGDVVIDGVEYTDVYKLNSWDFDTAYVFETKNYNPYTANYTNTIYDLYPDKWGDYYSGGDGNWMNSDQLQLNGGLLNGSGAPNVYSLWASPGAIQSGYGVTNNTQVGLNAAASADIGNHEFKFGFQFEQRVESGYGYNAQPLWEQMRGLTNFHIRELDALNPVKVVTDGVFQDTVIYYRKYDAGSQYTFDANLRKKLGLEVTGLDYILIDSYDYDNGNISYYDKDGTMHTKNVGTDLLNIDLFSADELLYNGAYFANYFGYDYKGNKLKTRPTFDDFFTKMDDNGNYKREIPAFEPIYMAGYVQDKFAFNDLIFNVGVRVDRFDANQPILKDNYLFFPAYSVGEKMDVAGQPVTHPTNMGSDYIIYIDNNKNPTAVTGYRNGDTWYDAQGIEIQDPFTLNRGFGVSPYIKPNDGIISSSAFEDYEPQINVMPRISFSFPISDEALFFAHYDVLTQRPTSGLYSDPSVYLFINTIGGTINNPSLKPTKTIDYELGFQQKLGNTSSLKISAFYREMRDDIQVYRFNGVYPKDYTSFNNIDFGTIKGLTVSYDLRRTNNASINASYTLQFADGTGSSTTTAAALVASGLPNLRTTNPLNWDRRHNLNILFDYRFDEDKKYNGPMIKNKQILKNTGFSLTAIGGSGTPYSAQEGITSALFGTTRNLEGTINGSRLPWQFRLDLRADKEIHPKWGKSGNTYLDVYVQVLNILNTKNIMGVYSTTGNADDDGYLAAAEWQKEINEQINPQSYRDLYAIRINSPFNYSSPRMIRVGIQMNF